MLTLRSIIRFHELPPTTHPLNNPSINLVIVQIFLLILSNCIIFLHYKARQFIKQQCIVSFSTLLRRYRRLPDGSPLSIKSSYWYNDLLVAELSKRLLTDKDLG